MINSDEYSNDRTQSKVAIYSRSPIQNTHCRSFMIRKSKYIIEFNKQLSKY